MHSSSTVLQFWRTLSVKPTGARGPGAPGSLGHPLLPGSPAQVGIIYRGWEPDSLFAAVCRHSPTSPPCGSPVGLRCHEQDPHRSVGKEQASHSRKASLESLREPIDRFPSLCAGGRFCVVFLT